jgi:hypothetical protein
LNVNQVPLVLQPLRTSNCTHPTIVQQPPSRLHHHDTHSRLPGHIKGIFGRNFRFHFRFRQRLETSTFENHGDFNVKFPGIPEFLKEISRNSRVAIRPQEQKDPPRAPASQTISVRPEPWKNGH